MSLMEKFADPSMMHSLSFGDKMAGAGITTLMGMGITFIVLILLWLVISILTRIVRGTQKKKEAPAAPAAAPEKAVPAAAVAQTPAEAPAAAPPAEEMVDDAQLIAVIAAAIAAAEGSEIQSNLVVRKIRRDTGPTVAWAREGREECLESRRM